MQLKNMKKKIYLILIVIFALGVLPGCMQSKTTNITEQAQGRTDVINRGFQEWYGETDLAEFHIEKTGDMQKNQAQKLIQKMETQMSSCNQLFDGKQKQKPVIYVTQKDAVNGGVQENSFFLNKTVFTSFDFAESGEYLASYIRVAQQDPPMWICEGIAGEAINSQVNENDLTIYYGDESNSGTLLLSDIRFLRPIALEETDIAIGTAKALWNFIQSQSDEKQLEKLANYPDEVDLIKWKNQWLQSIGISYTYENPYEGQLNHVHGYTSLEYDVQIQTDDAVFDITRDDGSTGNLVTTPYYLETILYHNQKGLDAVKAYIDDQNAGDLIDCSKKLHYIFSGKYQYGATWGDNQEIILFGEAQEDGHIHEAVHYYVGVQKASEDVDQAHYLAEGIASYMQDVIPREYSHWVLSLKTGSYKEYDLEQDMCQNPAGLGNRFGNEKLAQEMKDYYLEQGGSLELEKFDGILFADAFSHSFYSLLTQKALTDEDLAYEIKVSYSYYFAESWFHYLVGRYSFRQACELIEQYPCYEQVTGESFEQLREDWLNQINVHK